MQPDSQPDLFAPPPSGRLIEGDCFICAGAICPTPDVCYPLEPLPEERRL